jgi:hypothetical protein
MGTPSPELKQLWIRVLKRVHPDLAIDEQDRIRCERLTQLANEAYRAGNVEALRAVLRPSQPHPKTWFRLSTIPAGAAFSLIAIAVVILISTSRGAGSKNPAAQVDSVKTPVQAHVEVPDGIWQSHPDSLTKVSLVSSGLQSAPQDRQQAPLKTSPPSALYMKQMRERLYQSFSNYERVDINVPAGNSAEIWFDVTRDGLLSNVRVGKPSGWDSLDYACKRAVLRTETVGALPEEYTLRTLPATFACTYTGDNVLQPSRAVDSAADRSDVFVGSVRNTNP